MSKIRFDGPHYVPELDDVRLGAQLLRIFRAMRDRQWRTLDEIHRKTGDPHASISAQLRHLRKPRFGGYTVEVRRRGKEAKGLFEYRLDDPQEVETEAAEDLDLSTLEGRTLRALDELRNAQTRTQRLRVVRRALQREQGHFGVDPETMEIHAVAGFVRHYYGGPDDLIDAEVVRSHHRWYTGQIHSADDVPLTHVDDLRKVLRELGEGVPVEIVVRVKGQPEERLVDDPWVMVEPHTYGPLSKRVEKAGGA